MSPPRSHGARSGQPKRSVIRKESTKMPGDCGDRDTLLGCRAMSRKKLPGAGRDAKAFAEMQETANGCWIRCKAEGKHLLQANSGQGEV